MPSKTIISTSRYLFAGLGGGGGGGEGGSPRDAFS